MSGARIAAKVTAGLRKAGVRTGTGPVAATILRTAGVNESVYPPTGGTVSEFACTVMVDTYAARDRDGTQITARDVRVYVAPDAATDPRNGDRLRIGAKTFHIVNVSALQPGAVVLMWDVQARAADG